eukprot:COSAG02_NODE_240_length_27672_cov_67.291445_19_plen_76_part_00
MGGLGREQQVFLAAMATDGEQGASLVRQAFEAVDTVRHRACSGALGLKYHPHAIVPHSRACCAGWERHARKGRGS